MIQYNIIRAFPQTPRILQGRAESTACCIIIYRIISIWYYVTYCIMVYSILFYSIILYHIILCHIVLYCVILCYLTLSYITLYHINHITLYCQGRAPRMGRRCRSPTTTTTTACSIICYGTTHNKVIL